MLEVVVLSQQKMEIKQDDGSYKTLYRVYAADADGKVGSVYSQKPAVVGKPVALELAVSKDGKFTVRIPQ